MSKAKDKLIENLTKNVNEIAGQEGVPEHIKSLEQNTTGGKDPDHADKEYLLRTYGHPLKAALEAAYVIAMRKLMKETETTKDEETVMDLSLTMFELSEQLSRDIDTLNSLVATIYAFNRMGVYIEEELRNANI
jgi:hypothetical protein